MSWTVTNWYRTQHYYDSGDWRATWSGEGGGVMMNQCPHNLDIWQWILGVPSSVRAFCRCGRYHQIDVEDDVTLYATYPNGATATFITSTGEYPGTNRLEVCGTLGKVVVENKTLKWYRLSKDEREICATETKNTSREPVEYSEITQENKEKAHLGILRNFANAILHGEKLISPGSEGIYGVSMINAAYLSDWTGRAVSLPLSAEDEALYGKLLKEKQDAEQNSEDTRKKECVQEFQTARQTGAYEERWDVRW